jgi:diguanylate cyclase (GGDEF)-like protein
MLLALKVLAHRVGGDESDVVPRDLPPRRSSGRRTVSMHLQMTVAPTDLSELASSVGAVDLFVMRRVIGDRFVHLGGTGRGESWAGNVELCLAGEPAATEAMRESRIVEVDHSPGTGRIFGPYHSPRAVFVPVSGDVLVVFGGLAERPGDRGPAWEAALIAAEAIEHVSPAKRLGDELEILHAVRDITDGVHTTLDEAGRHVLDSAAASLSCESGALWLADGDRSWWAVGKGSGPIDIAAALPALREIREQGLPTCVQDAAATPLPAQLSALGTIAYYALPIDGPVGGLLLLIHTKQRPRGFTSLCQLLGQRLVEAAGPVLAAAAHRELLQAEIARVNELARSDSLTGLANRLAWDEAIAAYPAASPAVVVVVDVDGLKSINDTDGHDAGDQVIQHVGKTLRASVREDDLVARIGGDEFAVLLGVDQSDAAIARITRCFIGCESYGMPLSVSVGFHKREPGDSLRDAQSRADDDMYARKQATHALTASLPGRAG